MKKTILVLLVIISCSSAWAQKETYNWYFGRNNGLDFTNTQSINHPTFGLIPDLPRHTTGPINTYEGCFVISDKDGKFLFASDGITVYNGPSSTNIMKNGTELAGHPSATQSGIAVPMPGSPQKYYVITSPCEEQRRPGAAVPSPGQCYSVIDMSVTNTNGRGEVVAGKKNIPLSRKGLPYALEDMPENLTVVGHLNGIDFWLVNRMRDLFVVWPVTEAGIGDPKAYSTGYDLGDHRLHNFAPGAINALDYRASGMGVIKFSPNGELIAHADYANGTLSMAHFNPDTGIISNPQVVKNTGLQRIYGIEFSPNGKYIYIGVIQTAVASQRGMYVLESNNIAKTPYKKIAEEVSNVQLGSRNRIFAISEMRLLTSAEGKYYDTYLWVILNPDEGGTKVARLTDFLPHNNSGRLGLPPFITTYFRLEGVYCNKYPCITKEYEYEAYLFQPTGQHQISYLMWDFGDGTPLIKQNYEDGNASYRVSHIYKGIGKQTVKVTPYSSTNVEITGSILRTEVNVRYCHLIINSATTDKLINRD